MGTNISKKLKISELFPKIDLSKYYAQNEELIANLDISLEHEGFELLKKLGIDLVFVSTNSDKQKEVFFKEHVDDEKAYIIFDCGETKSLLENVIKNIIKRKSVLKKMINVNNTIMIVIYKEKGKKGYTGFFRFIKN